MRKIKNIISVVFKNKTKIFHQQKVVLIWARGSDCRIVKNYAELVGRQQRDKKIPACFTDLADEFSCFVFIQLIRFHIRRFPFVTKMKDRFQVRHTEDLHLICFADAQISNEFFTECD